MLSIKVKFNLSTNIEGKYGTCKIKLDKLFIVYLNNTFTFTALYRSKKKFGQKFVCFFRNFPEITYKIFFVLVLIPFNIFFNLDMSTVTNRLVKTQPQKQLILMRICMLIFRSHFLRSYTVCICMSLLIRINTVYKYICFKSAVMNWAQLFKALLPYQSH